MKIYYILIAIILVACNQKTKLPIIKNNSSNGNESNNFFPVTSYIKGQILDITSKGVNPLQYNTINGITDSMWIKSENINTVLHEFLTPIIDTTNLINLYKESRFNDQSVDAFTFTYEPIGKLPDSLNLKNWTIYIDPNTNTVRRIYLEKKLSDNKIMQLTWQSNKWCKIITLIPQLHGGAKIEKELKLVWDF